MDPIHVINFALLCSRAPFFRKFQSSSQLSHHFHTFSSPDFSFSSLAKVTCFLSNPSPSSTLSHLNIRSLTSIAIFLNSHFLLDFICTELLTEITAPHILLILWNVRPPTDPHLSFVFSFLHTTLGITRELAISKLYTPANNLSSKPLVKLCKSKFSRIKHFWSHHESHVTCHICSQIIPRLSLFVGDSATCGFIPCCYNLVHLSCREKFLNQVHNQCSECLMEYEDGYLSVHTSSLAAILNMHKIRDHKNVHTQTKFPQVTYSPQS